MPGPKQSLGRPKKASKQQKRTPETADEYLDQGVSLEEAAEKWRAGDAAKAARFYVRALETYDQALGLFPDTFDLAYNKARIQYGITQHPAVRARFPAANSDLLQTALQSNRKALSLDPTNADALFNTAQVLTSLAEAVNSGGDNDENDTVPIAMLQEAVTLFKQCLNRQELLYDEARAQMPPVANDVPSNTDYDEGGVHLESKMPLDDSVMQWATIVEPVTQSSLVDTSVSLLDTLSTLCSLTTDTSSLAPVGELANQILRDRLPLYIDGLDDEAAMDETLCASARFRATFSEAEFRLKRINFNEFDQRLQGIFGSDKSDKMELPDRSPAFLICFADALVSFAVAGVGEVDNAVLRFKRLTKALDCLAAASKLPNAKGLSSIHLARGDAEMLRFSACMQANVPDTLANDSTRKTLLQNAEKYYRGAVATAHASPDVADGTVKIAAVKQVVVTCMLEGNNTALIQLRSSGPGDASIRKVITEMIEESLVQERVLNDCQVL